MVIKMMKTWIVGLFLLLLSTTTFADVVADDILLSVELDEDDGTILSAFVPAEQHTRGATAAAFARELLAKNTPQIQLTEQDALDIGALLATAASEPETQVLINRLKYGSGASDLAALKREQSVAQIMEGLRQSVSQLKLLEVLFDRDPAAALAEMEQDDLIPPENLAAYRAQPELLESDMRKAYYFSFVSLAVAGELL
jgi:hypothetical protein